MKKLNLNVTIKNLNGVEIKQGENTLLVKDIVANALAVSKPVNPALETIKQLNLALRVNEVQGEEDFDDSDVTLMKNVIEKNDLQYTVLVVGQILKILG